MSQKIVANFFRYASQSGASHLVILNRDNKLFLECHFSDGRKQSFSLPPKINPDITDSLRSIFQIKPGELPAGKAVKMKVPSGRLDFHVTITPSDNQEKIIISIIDKNQRNWRLSQLGLQTHQKKEILNFLQKKSGLLIVSSPPNQGKSATAFAIAAEKNSENNSLYALEDLPEAKLDGINCLPQNADNWARMLKYDADLIIADSLEKDDNLENALKTASTGRLVIGAMEAADSLEVLGKISSLNLPLKFCLDNLKMIVNQRLATFDSALKSTPTKKRRIIGLFEILKITPRLKKMLINNGRTSDPKFWIEVKSTAMREGFRPLELDRQKKIKNRIITGSSNN